MYISSISGRQMPESWEDFKKLRDAGTAANEKCCECRTAFNPAIVYSRDGWSETQISGLCEACWDEMLEEEVDSHFGDEEEE